MSMTKWIGICLLAVALVPAGCSKKGSQETSQPPAVAIDVPKLRQTFETASPDLQALAKEAMRNVQYGRYAVAEAALEKLAAAPGLTDEQKKVVAEVTAQTKQMAVRAAALPTQ